MADKKENIIQTLSAETDAKYAAGKAVEEIVRRIVRAQDTDSIDKVLVISDGCLRLADISLFKVEYTLTVIATPSSATITINGVQTDTVTVLAGAAAIITVEASGYLPYSNTVIVNKDTTLYVNLDSDYITVTPSSFALNNMATSGNEISVSTPGTWTAQAPSWITLSSTSGEGDSQITFSVEENPDTIERVDTIIFTSQTGITAIVSVEQEAKESESLSVSPSSVVLANEGGSFTLSITSNTSWTITSSGDITLSFSQTSGEGNATVTVTYTQSSTMTDYRSGTITVTTTSGEKRSTVSLRQNPGTPVVTISPTELSGRLGNNFTFLVTVNEYTDYLYVAAKDFAYGSTSGITTISLQGSKEHAITEDGKYSVMPSDSFNMVVSTTSGSGGTTYGTLEVVLTPYNGEDYSGEDKHAYINLT